jgi:hypothetical protein
MSEHVEHLWTVLCRSVHRDAQGLVSLDGLLDMVHIGALPSEPALIDFECYVVSHWRRNRDPGVELRQRVMFQREDDVGTRVQVAEPAAVGLQRKHLFMVINRVRALPVQGYGQYFFVVEREVDARWQAVAPSAGLWIPSPQDGLVGATDATGS